ncbi:hypothetical protein BH23CHL5_BH23CHL5_13490 [soil metagenome]
MTTPRLGLSYFGNRYLDHAKVDIAAIAATGAEIIDHVMDEADLRWNPETIKDLVAASKKHGLETWLAPWGLGGAFGGEAASYAVMEAPAQCQRDNLGNYLPALCLNQPAYGSLMTRWLDAAAAAQVDVVTWDEPHLFLPPPTSADGRWACRCETCQTRFRNSFDRSMPEVWDEDIAAFCQDVVGESLDTLIREATRRGIDSAVIFAPEDAHGDRGWREIAAMRGVRYFGISPYWVLAGIPEDVFEPWLRNWCKRVAAATQDQTVQSLTWIQAFSVPAGRETEIERGMEIMQEEGIDVVCAWSFRACESMSLLTPDNPQLVWESVQRGFAKIRKGR